MKTAVETVHAFFYLFVQDGPRVTSNAAASLKDFCTWQYVTNPTDDSNPDHYDTAVLITR